MCVSPRPRPSCEPLHLTLHMPNMSPYSLLSFPPNPPFVLFPLRCFSRDKGSLSGPVTSFWNVLTWGEK